MLEMHAVSKVFRTEQVQTHALRSLDLHVKEGEFVAVTGPSGSGKTTFLNIAGLLETFTSGTYLLDGEDVSHLGDDARSRLRNRKIGFIFQGFNLIPDLNLFDNVDVPLRYRGMPAAERRERIEKALADVGQRLLDALAALGGRHAAVAQRHVDVVEQVQVGDQVEALEDEADLAVAQARAGVVAEVADVFAVEQVGAAGEGFQQAGDVEEGGLARAGRPGDGDELAFLHVQVQRAQGVGLHLLGAEDLGDGVHFEHGGVLRWNEWRGAVGTAMSVERSLLRCRMTGGACRAELAPLWHDWRSLSGASSALRGDVNQCTVTRGASPNWSAPETTTRSPSFRPERISVSDRLDTPSCTGWRWALDPSMT